MEGLRHRSETPGQMLAKVLKILECPERQHIAITKEMNEPRMTQQQVMIILIFVARLHANAHA